MSSLTKDELKALAMHEIMKREQEKYASRIAEQRRIALMTDETLRAIVNGGEAKKIKGDS